MKSKAYQAILGKNWKSIIEDSLKSDDSRLSAREKGVIKARVFKNKTLQKIGNEFGVTRERIRQIEEVALHRLESRKKIKSHMEKWAGIIKK